MQPKSEGQPPPLHPTSSPQSVGEMSSPGCVMMGHSGCLLQKNHQVLKHLRAEGRLPGLAPGNPT